jgi:hydrogenase maturation protease
MILVIGVGNPTRRDDGAGPEVVRRLDALGLTDVELRSETQLDPSLAIDLIQYEKVVVVDADPEAKAVVMEEAPAEIGESSTHHFTPSSLRLLATTLHGRSPQVWVCRIPASDFDFGENFSPVTKPAIEDAVGKIKKYLSET